MPSIPSMRKTGILGVKHRWDAIKRVFAFLYAWVLGVLIGWLFVTVAIALAAIDVALQFLFNMQALNPAGTLYTQLAVIFNWWMDLNIYAFTGQGGFSQNNFLPEWTLT